MNPIQTLTFYFRRPVSITAFHLRLDFPRDFLPSVLPTKCIYDVPHSCYVSHYMISRITYGEAHKLQKPVRCNFIHPMLFPNILSTPCYFQTFYPPRVISKHFIHPRVISQLLSTYVLFTNILSTPVLFPNILSTPVLFPNILSIPVLFPNIFLSTLGKPSTTTSFSYVQRW